MNQWFKFYGSEFLADPKMASLTPVERSCWVTLLCLASTSTNPGSIEFLTTEVLLTKSGVVWDPYNPDEWNSCLGVLTKFKQMKMIELSENGEIYIKNWEKRQQSFQTDAERARKYRENKRNRHEPSDERHARIEENRIDKSINTSRAKRVGTLEAQVIDSFKEVNPSYKNLFKRKNQHESANRLVEIHGLDKVLKVVDFASKMRSDRFCPAITTPIQLEEKWGLLEAYALKLKGGNGKGKEIIGLME